MSNAEPKINFTLIDFPSDQITVKTLRTSYPQCFDANGESSIPPSLRHPQDQHNYGRINTEKALGDLICCERILATRAFKNSLGQLLTDEDKFFSRDEAMDSLGEIYQLLGLAQGDKTAMHLIKTIEQQAQKQASMFTR